MAQLSQRMLGSGESWIPEPIYDIYALGLGIASLIKKGTIPWDGFYQSQATTASIDH